MDKEEKKKINDTKKYNKLVEEYNRAVERKDKKHHQLAVQLANEYHQQRYKKDLKEITTKHKFDSLLKKIKKWRVSKMINQNKFEKLTEDQKEQYKKVAKEYQEAQEANAARRLGGPGKEASERFGIATKEYAEFISLHGLNRS